MFDQSRQRNRREAEGSDRFSAVEPWYVLQERFHGNKVAASKEKQQRGREKISGSKEKGGKGPLPEEEIREPQVDANGAHCFFSSAFLGPHCSCNGSPPSLIS